jgi:hypothetical protein
MKRLTAIIALTVSMLLVLLLASGCFGQNIAERIAEEVIEKAIEEDNGENVEIDLDDDGITIKGEDGEVSISADDETVEIKSDDGEFTIGIGAELPEGFPGNVPVYPDMEITTSWKSTEDDKVSFSISGLTEEAGDDVFAWYKDKLSGWEIESEFTASGDDVKTSSLSVKSDGLIMVLMVIESDDEGTIITQSVTEE